MNLAVQTPPTTVTTRDLGPDLTVTSFCSDAGSSHLLVRGKQSLLIDCHTPELESMIRQRGLPLPGRILHTHVQPGHCREAGTFAGAAVAVPRALLDLATDSPTYRRATRTVWDKPEEWGVTLGREAWGVGGCVTMLPPSPPLVVHDTFAADDVLTFADLELQVIALPGHGRDGVGFLLRQQGQAKALFIGDLFRDPAVLVNFYDLEVAYGPTLLPQMPALLGKVAQLGVDLFLPATGPIIADGPRQARLLAQRIHDYISALQWKPDDDTDAPAVEYPSVGRYLRIDRGIYQINNFGNCILLIDDAGHGLFIDPGPCDYENRNRHASFLADLDLFHQQCGLKTVDLALVTHFHGDHYDCYPLLQQRYPQCRLAAWEPVAAVLEAPEKFPYPCTLPWYNLGLGAMKVDVKTHRSAPLVWRGVEIHSVHLPGHCMVHAGYILTFQGKRLAITGDTIQTRGGSESINFIIANDSVPDDRDGCLAAYQTMLRYEIDLNLGGHGSHFTDCRRMYDLSERRMRHALPALRALVPGGDLTRAFRRPWYPPLVGG